MTTSSHSAYRIAVIGAGPAGLFAARTLAAEGVQVTIFNRDIKAGGLAEYGIYPDKEKMKGGLRNQFWKILEDPLIDYYGHVTIGQEGELSLEDLLRLGFDAILVTVGAQGTKWLGLPGEDLRGVYHAKDLVYHYNQLPPYTSKYYPIGKRVGMIGAGNVMIDVAHWVVRDLKVAEATAFVRRGPGDVKFSAKEWEIVAANLDLTDFESELARVKPVLDKVGQEVSEGRELILGPRAKALRPVSDTRFRFHFLASPVRILGDSEGRVEALEIEETALELTPDGGARALANGITHQIPIDTVVFCIGDRVDRSFGLPVSGNEFAKNPAPQFPVEGLSYEAKDLAGVFLAGWAREASTGLVGAARRDGVNGARAVLKFLGSLPADKREPVEDFSERLKVRMAGLDKKVVSKEELYLLKAVEEAEAEARGLESFRFSTDEEMLAAIAVREPL